MQEKQDLCAIQIEELLKEVSITERRKTEFKQWKIDFDKYLLKAKPSKPFEIFKWARIANDVCLPLPSHIKLHEETIQWNPPAAIKIIGSWETGCSVEKISQIDLALELPKEFLRKKDYLNHKYHIKRALYLAYIAKLLSKRGDQIQFSTLCGNHLKPVLEITFKRFIIKLLIVPPKNYFKLSRFNPNTNNVRFESLFEKSSSSDIEFATPNYNFSILTDVMIYQSQKDIYNRLANSRSYNDAVKLLKVWLRQRSLDKGFGGFSGFIMTAFLAYLSSTNKVNALMSCIDVLRIVFKSLSEMDLTKTGISFSPDVKIQDWHLQFDVVFIDSTGTLNYTADMTKFTFNRIKLEANRALRSFEESKVAGFQAIFLTSVSFVQNFDHILQIPCTKMYSFLTEDSFQTMLNYSELKQQVIITAVGPLIEQCLGKRVTLIDHELLPELKWDIRENFPDTLDHEVIRFGFIICREAAYKVVEKCEEDHVKAKAFKEFWGEKSQLRRFKDGTMCETIVFEDKSKVLYEMIMYIFQKHLNLKPDFKFGYLDHQIEDVIERGFLMSKKLQKPKTFTFKKGKRMAPVKTDFMELVPVELDTIADKATNAFDELAKTLRSLEGLPLEVSTVQGTSSVLRFTNVHPTPPQRFHSSKLYSEVKPNKFSMTFKRFKEDEFPLKVPKVVEPISVVLHLETSGKWPDDIDAIQKLKCAFLIRIGQLLKEQFGLVVQPHARFLDILKDGFVFRIKLTYFRELTLLKQQLGTNGVIKMRDNPESLLLEKESLLLPQLTTTLHSFKRQFEAFGKTCRIAKRWISAQLLLASPLQYNNSEQPDCRFTEECIELIVANLFLLHAPHLNPPNEAQLGFLRFLFYLSSTDWKATPIILNFHDKMSDEEISIIELDFVKRRHQLPALFIATPEDQTASVWTKDLAPVILFRAQQLAKEALKVLQNCFQSQKIIFSDDSDRFKPIKRIFRADTQEFDMLIHLKKSLNPRTSENLDAQNVSQFKEYFKTSEELLPITDFDPVQIYLQCLRDEFGHLALFLHNNYGGMFIAVVLKPDAFQTREFTTSDIKSSKRKTTRKLFSNVDELLESFEALGHGFVDVIAKKNVSK